MQPQDVEYRFQTSCWYTDLKYYSPHVELNEMVSLDYSGSIGKGPEIED